MVLACIQMVELVGKSSMFQARLRGLNLQAFHPSWIELDWTFLLRHVTQPSMGDVQLTRTAQDTEISCNKQRGR